jgi:light-regulated signal transduction histidine kinase (bacteriophytochrome)
LEGRVRERTAQLEATVEELSAFSYSIAHDLRAPLRAIHSYAQILHDDCASQLDGQAEGYLQRVSDSALRMGQLIDDLLAFTQLNHEPLRKREIAMTELVRQALDELRPGYAQRQIEFTLRDLPVCQADPALLKQVWVNLLDNALKFTRQQTGARIEVGYHEEQGKPIYFVRDNGVGFDMQYEPQLFGVFQRLHRREDYEGTGIGLAITKRIVQRHGGRIWAEAALGQGTTFFFTLG